MAQIGEYVKMALQNIWANKIRTLLTMLGIIIGISSVILIVSIGNGATELISSELSDIAKGQIYFYDATYEDKYVISEDELEDIRKMDGIKAVGIQEILDGAITTKKDDFTVNVVAVNSDGLLLLNRELVQGRFFGEKEAENGKPYCIISESDAMKLFGSTNIIGMDIDMTVAGKDITYTVCGITKSTDEGMVLSINADPSVQVVVSPQSITNQTGIDLNEQMYGFYVLKEDAADGKEVCDRVIDYLETKHHCKGQDIYSYESFDDIMSTVNSVIRLITVFVAFVASVSLLVGGIGVMNIMLVSVTERTREIGIRKALGAKTGSITIQFLAESAFITLLGGIIGILLGVAGAWIIAGIIGIVVPNMNFAPALSPGIILMASAFSTVVGLIFGVYPARKAAKLSPIEALRQN